MSVIDYLFLIIAIPAILVIGIQLIRGKWLMLIAGYNTMVKEERKKVNGPNLGKLIGSYLIFLDFLLIFLSIGLFSPSFFVSLIILSSILIVIIGNTSKYFKQKLN